MSWLWIKFLAPKPLKFPKTNIKTRILLLMPTPWCIFFLRKCILHLFILFFAIQWYTKRSHFSYFQVSFYEVFFWTFYSFLKDNSFASLHLAFEQCMSSDESAHGAQSTEPLESRPELHCAFGGAAKLWIVDSPQNNLCHWCTSPSPTKAQHCSSVSKMSFHFAGMNYISISKAFTLIIFRTSCRMILLPDIKSEQI